MTDCVDISVIIPLDVTIQNIVSHNVNEDEYADWNENLTYHRGTRSRNHRAVVQSWVDGNIGNVPILPAGVGADTLWLPTGGKSQYFNVPHWKAGDKFSVGEYSMNTFLHADGWHVSAVYKSKTNNNVGEPPQGVNTTTSSWEFVSFGNNVSHELWANTAHTKGDVVFDPVSGLVYEASKNISANTSNPEIVRPYNFYDLLQPEPTSERKWEYVQPAGIERLFDAASSTRIKSSQTRSVTYHIDDSFTRVGLHGLEGDSARIIITDSAGMILFDETKQIEDIIDNWLDWFNPEFEGVPDLLFEVGQMRNVDVHIIITGVNELGAVIFGTPELIGTMQLGSGADDNVYSKMEQNVFGFTQLANLRKRSYVKIKSRTYFDKYNYDDVREILGKIVGIPTYFIGSNKFESFNVYGVLPNHGYSVKYSNYAINEYKIEVI